MIDYRNTILSWSLIKEEKSENEISDYILDKEHIIESYKTKEGAIFFTNSRIIIYDIRKASDDYTFIPYKKVSIFSVTIPDIDEYKLLTLEVENIGQFKFKFEVETKFQEIVKKITIIAI